ncbi:isoaspartyl peptidase/L-asparaginase [Microbulbifer flavimaris]|uniref:Isoaspartyl peptidase/L-asparaginase n=1 Tax=Microbulbifer flavimaris TaxID=1781068 RepID=A0ABX4HXN5_9GAMM|nr:MULTISPECIES: isoaspartyl peptidase/L-asparaginase [Microbulbifer]KUJ79205.1 isoaspartyl peptidase [Microbulbifer sp. ZGT114]PCO04129.1 isoaspartyl peptidase/L-asparaginase [Microbulbifer flavimaris]
MKLLRYLSLALISIWLPAQAVQAEESPIAIAIHGGAGTIERSKLAPEQERAYRQKLTEAVNAGYRVLEDGGESLDAVSAAIRILEDSPLFNAGVGAVYTYEGRHELDASIMEGKSRQAGAVAGVTRVRNPIDLARMVMEDSPHVMLAGTGAEAFAQSRDMDMVDNSLFDTERRRKQLEDAKKKIEAETRRQSSEQAAVEALPVAFRMGTVGAVALDKAGNLAAGTSTGGMTAKRYGRIGDSPVIGAGTFADNASCAVSATGHGEYFIRFNVAADICARVQYQGKSVAEAADAVINDVLRPVGGTGGVIVLDAAGNIALTFNTPGMYRASRSSGSPLSVGIFDKE